VKYPGRLGLQQRVLPAYRVPFIDMLAGACQGGLSMFAGEPQPVENIFTSQELKIAQYYPAYNQHFMDPSSSLYKCTQINILEWLEGWNPDVLIVEANPRYPSNLQAADWMHARGRPVIGWGLGAPPLQGLSAYWRKRKRLKLLNALDALIAYSQRGADEYRALGFPADRVYVAFNAASPRPTQPPPERSMEFKDKPVLLFVGRLQARKRIDNLLNACADLPEVMQPRLWIVGDGPAGDELRALAKRIYPQAEFLGAIYGDNLDSYFAESDLFVLPGTGGLAVQQAMAFALPVIVAQGDGTQEDLVQAENGWLVPAGDISTLTSTIKSALSDPERLRKMGQASYRLVRDKINIESMVDVFVDVLSDTVYNGK